ncbi:MAG: DUF5668 domain-containing protein [Patescibacteria group bacterium]
MVPLFILLIGVTFLLQALDILSAGWAAIIWPSLLILIGLQKLFSRMCKCCCC